MPCIVRIGATTMSRGDEDAFPTAYVNVDGESFKSDGLTIREHFAAMAMQGFLSDSAVLENLNTLSEKDGRDPDDLIAIMAIRQADALIEALEKRDE
jgi:hypothetical protein